MPQPVNNVTRLLDAKKIQYQVFELPAEKLGAIESAQIMQVEANLVYKTIVVTRTSAGKPLLAVVPGNAEVDLKALAKSIGEKKLNLATEREAERLTGLQAGGISPLALMNKGFEVVIDSSAQNHTFIHISGGQRGLNIRLKPVDLFQLTHARLASICSAPE
jgi:Cys-tRNA(Pro)/Cys-tRNA(Cys) deacylase